MRIDIIVLCPVMTLETYTASVAIVTACQQVWRSAPVLASTVNLVTGKAFHFSIVKLKVGWNYNNGIERYFRWVMILLLQIVVAFDASPGGVLGEFKVRLKLPGLPFVAAAAGHISM